MRIYDIKAENISEDNPSALVSKYLLHENQGGRFSDFILQFDWLSRDDLEKGIRHFIRSVVLDKYMRQKHLSDKNPTAAILFTRFNRIMTSAKDIDKYPSVLASELWHGGYSREKLVERMDAMFSKQPNKDVFLSACERIKRIYSLSADDINKLHFFVEQVKAGDRFPNSLRRLLYIYGVEKMTGKTTSANMLVSLLNGDDNWQNISRYSSALKYEMQIQSFAVPKISECSCVLMDECFYHDMGKTYADFKRFLTSSNGRARVPFGQEFDWYGQPNYIATSNEPLVRFIKDWNDRRYLAVEFTAKPTERLSFDDIHQLWKDFVVNSERTKDWDVWANELSEVANEAGERQVISDELEVIIRRNDFLTRILNMTPNTSKSIANNNNRMSLSQFVKWFFDEVGQSEAIKRRGEIEQALTNVFGPKYSNTCYWLVSSLQETARKLYSQNQNEPIEPIIDHSQDDSLPF